MNTCYILTFNDVTTCSEKLQYLLGFMNSKLALFYLDMITSKLDETGWRWLKQFVEDIPVPRINADIRGDYTQTFFYNQLGLSDEEISFLNSRF